MVHSKKRQRIEELPHGVCLNTWLRSVQEAAFFLDKIETKKVTSPRARSRSVLQDKLFPLEINALPRYANINVIIANTPKGERNRNLTKNQVSIKCPSYGLSSCTKTFCVAKCWWGIRPKNSNGTSNLILVHWSSHFKGLYEQKKIPILVMKMADNHLRNAFFHHQQKYGGTIFPYFNYHKKNKASDLIQAHAKVKKVRVARKLTDIDSETKNKRDASNQAVPDIIVRE